MLTVIFHVNIMQMQNPLIPHESSGLLHHTYLMVDFFFILSGFIMCHVYGKWFSEGVSGAQFKKFTIARFARVYPLHLVTLLYTILLFYVAGKLGLPPDVVENQNSGYSILTNLTLLHSMNLHEWFSWNHASWSISTEWWAYMVFPFLVGPFMRLGAYGKGLAAFLCFAGYLVITFWIVPIVTIPPEIPFVRVDPAWHSVNVAYQYGILRCLCGFVLGMMLYEGFKKGWGKAVLGNGYVLTGLTLASFACMHFELADIFALSFFPFILLSGAYGSEGINKVFATTPLQRLGDWSFSIYLVHQPLLFTIWKIQTYLNPVDPNAPPPPPDLMGAWLYCFGFIALMLVVSYFTYRLVEVPARLWLNPKKGV
jgi:peptidoglycan/LPS O-acetylase OafA/YrhL